MTTFREAGWVWEGHGFDPGLEPSVYGVGEGAAYFGLNRANFMFHRNTPANLPAKLRHLGQVVPEISKWKWVEIEPQTGKHGWGFAGWRDSHPETVLAEAADLSRVSLDAPNVTGALIDDCSAVFRYDAYNPDRPRQIRAALHSANPKLKLWVVVYTHELHLEQWQAFLPWVDVVNLSGSGSHRTCRSSGSASSAVPSYSPARDHHRHVPPRLRRRAACRSTCCRGSTRPSSGSGRKAGSAAIASSPPA